MNKYLLLLFACLLMELNSAKANHIMGSEVNWKYLGNDTFILKVVVYRQCTDGAAGLTLSSLPPTIVNDSCSGYGYTIGAGTPLSYLVEDITPLCISQQKPCPISGGSGVGNSGIPLGIERHTIRYKIYLGGNFANCCWYKIRWQLCCRSSFITTGFTNTDYFNESWLNRCTPGNSPRFTSPPLLIKQANGEVRYNPGMVDDDHDSLTYRMLMPSAAGNYDPPWSYKYPLTCYGGNIPNPNSNPPTGFNFDSITGNMVFTPTQISNTVIKFGVFEWRKVNGVMKVIGLVTRDLGFMVMQANNKLPFTSAPYVYDFCAGYKNCFTIQSGDGDAGEVTTLTLDSTFNIPNATFTTTTDLNHHANGTFCWTPDSADIRSQPYYFTVRLKDNHCPFNAEIYRGYTIRVNPNFKVSTNIQKLGCAEYHFLALNTDSTCFYRKWDVIKGNFTIQTFLNQDSILNYKFNLPGTYFIKYTATNKNCTVAHTDTIIIVNADKLLLNKTTDTTICQGSSIRLKATPLNGLPPFKYQWFLNNVLIDTNPEPIFLPILDSKYLVKVQSSDTCNLNTAEFINVNLDTSMLALAGIHDTIICPNTSLSFKATSLSGSPPLKYFWYENALLIDTTEIINLIPKKSTTYILKVQSSDPCYNIKSDTFSVVIDSVGLKVVPLSDTSICLGDSLQITPTILVGKPPYKMQWLENGITISTGNSLVMSLQKSTTYILKMQSADLCFNQFQDTFYVSVDTGFLQVSNISDDTVCYGTTKSFTPNVLSGIPPFQYYWYKNGALQSTANNYTPTINAGATYVLQMASKNQCRNVFSDTFTVNVFPIQQLKISSKTVTITVGQSITLYSNGLPPFQWTGNSIISNWNDSIAVKPSVTSSYTLKSNNKDGCMDSASITISVKSVGIDARMAEVNSGLILSPNPVSNELNIILSEHEKVMPVFYIYNAYGAIVSTIQPDAKFTILKVSQLPSGIYFLRCRQEIYKFIKY